LLLVHVPPPAAFVSSVQAPRHTCRLPPIVDGAVFTVTTTEALQPAVVINTMVDVPADKPLTVPVAFTLATVVLLLCQLPPPAPSERVVVEPTHMPVLPVIGDIGFTTTLFVATQVPPSE